jgi:hypothetical protein
MRKELDMKGLKYMAVAVLGILFFAGFHGFKFAGIQTAENQRVYKKLRWMDR